MFRLRSSAFSRALVLMPLAVVQAAQAGGGNRCSGTLYQLQVNESGSDRLRSLSLQLVPLGGGGEQG